MNSTADCQRRACTPRVVSILSWTYGLRERYGALSAPEPPLILAPSPSRPGMTGGTPLSSGLSGCGGCTGRRDMRRTCSSTSLLALDVWKARRVAPGSFKFQRLFCVRPMNTHEQSCVFCEPTHREIHRAGRVEPRRLRQNHNARTIPSFRADELRISHRSRRLTRLGSPLSRPTDQRL